MAAPAFGSVGTYLGGSGTLSPAFPVPASVAANDIILVFMYTESTPEGNAVTATPPAGFTEAPNSPIITYNGTSEGQYQRVFWKRATGADTGTYTFTLGANSGYVEGVAVRFTGCVTSGNPFDVTTSANSNTAGTTTPAVSVTTTGADRLLVFGSTDWVTGTSTQPSGMTQVSVGGGRVFDIAYVAQSVAGGSGSLTATHTGSGPLTAWLGALLPISSAPHQAYVASTAVTAAYLGTTALSAIYVGTQQIWGP